MVGFVLVVSTPYFARSDSTGHARIAELPAGRYELHAWHPRERSSVAPQSIAVEGAASSAFVIDAAPRRPRYKPPLDRLKY